MRKKSEKLVAFGKAASIRSNESGKVVEGYLVAFTDEQRRDLAGEWFDARTDFLMSDHPVVGKPVLYNHGFDDVVSVRAIGEITNARVDDFGLWVEAQLKLRDEYEAFIAQLAREGKLGWSSGALPQSVVVDENGHINRWVIVEASLTPTPAEPLLTVVSAKALIKKKGQGKNMAKKNMRDIVKEIAEQQLVGVAEMIGEAIVEQLGLESEEDLSIVEEVLTDPNAITEVIGTVQDEIEQEIRDQAMGDDDEKSEDAMTSEDEEKELAEKVAKALIRATAQKVTLRLKSRKSKFKLSKNQVKSAVSEAMSSMRNERGMKLRDAYGLTQQTRVSVSVPERYKNLSASDMAFAAIWMSKRGERISDEFKTILFHRASEYAEQFRPYDRHNHHALKAALPFKANELNATSIAGQGLEWVGEFWSTDLWYREREPRIFDILAEAGMLVREVPRGASTAKFPTEGSGPIVYTRKEATDIDSTNRPEVTAKTTFFGTGVVEVSPKTIGFKVVYSDELLEDSVIDVASEANYIVREAMLEYRDRLLINGDTATAANTNINLIDGTPGSGLNAPYYLASDGFRKLPLVTATSKSRNANGLLSLEDYRATLGLVSSELRNYKNRLLFIIDDQTEIQSLAIPEIATDDVRRTNATVSSGELYSIYGVRVLKTNFLPRANTAGKVSNTPANNKKGTILIVYAPYWCFAFKRDLTIETTRDADSGTTGLVATMRAGVVARGTNAAALSYNVGSDWVAS